MLGGAVSQIQFNLNLQQCTTHTECAAAGFDRQYDLSADDEYGETIEELKRQFGEPRVKPTFDLLICGNDRIALIAYQFLLGQGLKIPADIAVLGFDNMIGVAELFYPPLSTVQLPYYEMGRRAAQHLIENKDEPFTHRLPCPLVKRMSW